MALLRRRPRLFISLSSVLVQVQVQFSRHVRSKLTRLEPSVCGSNSWLFEGCGAANRSIDWSTDWSRPLVDVAVASPARRGRHLLSTVAAQRRAAALLRRRPRAIRPAARFRSTRDVTARQWRHPTSAAVRHVLYRGKGRRCRRRQTWVASSVSGAQQQTRRAVLSQRSINGTETDRVPLRRACMPYLSIRTMCLRV